MGGKSVAKKNTKKEVKRLKKKARKLTAVNLTLEKEIRKLKKKLGSREQQAVESQASLNRAAPIMSATSPSVAEIGADDGGGIATSHRAAWKQHSYLRDRYESHLGTGVSKERARLLANDDLKTEYGSASGYSKEELTAILS